MAINSNIALIRTVEDYIVLPPNILYVEADNPQITTDIAFSVHLEINDPNLGNLQYNTIYEETLAEDNLGPEFVPGDGTNNSLRGQLLSEIAVTLYKRPPFTRIIPPKKVTLGTSQTWKLEDDYDPNNEYQYLWELVETPPAPIPVSIESGQGTKAITLRINARGVMYLRCNIFRVLPNGDLGCAQVPRIVQEVGFSPAKVVISRNRFT